MQFEPLEQFEQRRKKLERLRELGVNPYPHEFRWKETPADLVERFSGSSAADLESERREVRLAGRMISYRLMGKAGFAHVQGGGQRIQIYVRKDVVGERGFEIFQLLDLGDLVGVRGDRKSVV